MYHGSGRPPKKKTPPVVKKVMSTQEIELRMQEITRYMFAEKSEKYTCSDDMYTKNPFPIHVPTGGN